MRSASPYFKWKSWLPWRIIGREQEEADHTLIKEDPASGQASPATGPEDPASGQAGTASGRPFTPPPGLPASGEGRDVRVRAEILLRLMASGECQKVDDMMEAFRTQEERTTRSDIARYQGFNGMSPLHHAARHLSPDP